MISIIATSRQVIRRVENVKPKVNVPQSGQFPPKPSDFEEAVSVLLLPHNVEYLRILLKELDKDPHYLYHHELIVGVRIQRMLFNAGTRWDVQTIRHYWNRALRVALERLAG